MTFYIVRATLPIRFVLLPNINERETAAALAEITEHLLESRVTRNAAAACVMVSPSG